MHFSGKAAAAVAAAGIAVVGTLAAGGGAADAATGQSVTGCDLAGGQLAVGVAPSCSAPVSTVDDPTSITFSADPAFFTTLANSAVTGLVTGPVTETVSYTLSCNVNGAAATHSGSFTATSTTSTQTQTVSLQSAVGSPDPNSCTVMQLTASSQISLDAAAVAALQANNLVGSFSFAATATADTAVPGAIWMAAAKTSSGLPADICADDAGNKDAGSHIQVYQCTSDLAQFWVQTSAGQLVRNGDCMTESGGKIFLQKCTAANNAQVWDVKGTNGNFAGIVNKATGHCLTAAKAVNFTQLTGTTCASKADQKWTGPGKAPA